jgi:Xaa-Pro aminopeptidase
MTATISERRAALKQDMPRRIKALQTRMREHGVGAVLLTGTAGPGLFGVPKYFTNLSLWYGRAYVVIGVDHPEPALVHWSGFQAEWNRQEATTSWIETPDVAVALGSLAAFKRALAIALELGGGSKKLGVENMSQTWTMGESAEFKETCHDFETVDFAREIDAIRSVKSPVELNEIEILGEQMTRAIERFAEVASPGVPIWHASSAAEELLKAEGGSWGRCKMSLNHRPATIMPTVDRLFRPDDVILVELDYSGAFGHWYEMTSLLSFEPLTPKLQAKVDTYEQVIDLMVKHCRPGTRVGDLAPLADERFRELGYAPAGMHLPHAHSIGLDESDGPNSGASPDDILEADMVLALHPGTLFEDGSGYTMSDLFRVSSDGGIRQSRKDWLHLLAG